MNTTKRIEVYAEPEAFAFQHTETGRVTYTDQYQIDNGFEENNPRLQLLGPLYREAQWRTVDAFNRGVGSISLGFLCGQAFDHWGAAVAGTFLFLATYDMLKGGKE